MVLIKTPTDIKSSEITNKKNYLSRRLFVRGGIVAASAAATSLVYRNLLAPTPLSPRVANKIADVKPSSAPGGTTNEPLTSYENIANYNNFYEFSTSKSAVAGRARGFIARPWTVSVEGLVGKPRVYDLDDLLKLHQLEERIYRLRCVEGWSMVIPWIGVPLAKLLAEVEPLAKAKYVRFETLNDPKRMPNQKPSLVGLPTVLDWPYVEGLRLDEAMHPLTLLATGLYGEQLPPQNGTPIRLVVPWKYGFKSIKSIIKISLVEYQPQTTWNLSAPGEYGFYSNVNPQVSHPRWSQATERRIGEYSLRKTLPFNGYANQVAHLYAGMDLKRNF